MRYRAGAITAAERAARVELWNRRADAATDSLITYRWDGQRALMPLSAPVSGRRSRGTRTISSTRSGGFGQPSGPLPALAESLRPRPVITRAAGLARPDKASGDRRGRLAQPRLGARQLVLGAVLP